MHSERWKWGDISQKWEKGTPKLQEKLQQTQQIICNEYIAITREQANLKHLQRIFILQWWDSNQKGKFIWSKNHRQDPW